MELIKLGKKGQVTLPKGLLREIGVEGDTPMMAEASDDGAIVLRPAAVYPLEQYSDERITEFERENSIPEKLADRVRKLTASKQSQ